MITFEPKFIHPISKPILIVGEKPGRTRDNSRISLVGNKTGDFVAEAIGDRTNIILTNVVNELYSGTFDHKRSVADGINDLIKLIEEQEPRKIICLGAIARDYVASISIISCPVINLLHPSYINRFHTYRRPEYLKILSDELDK